MKTPPLHLYSMLRALSAEEFQPWLVADASAVVAMLCLISCYTGAFKQACARAPDKYHKPQSSAHAQIDHGPRAAETRLRSRSGTLARKANAPRMIGKRRAACSINRILCHYVLASGAARMPSAMTNQTLVREPLIIGQEAASRRSRRRV